MPRVRDEFLDCSFYLYPSVQAAQVARPKTGKGGGSGFLVGWASESAPCRHMYAVTCAHVVMTRFNLATSSQVPGSPVIRLNTKEGEKDIIERREADWIVDLESDLAVCPIDLSDKHQYRFVHLKYLIKQETIDHYDIGPGDECFMVGRFVNHEGRQKNAPTVRMGNIAMSPIEPVYCDDGRIRDGFLVELRSRGGYSGSPVFVMFGGARGRRMGRPPKDESTEVPFETFEWLLGVDCSQIPVFDQNIGAMIGSSLVAVTPAWKLKDFLMNDSQLQKERRQRELDANQIGAAQFESDTGELDTPTTDENPRHKEDFSSLLNAVAKGTRPGGQT